MNIAKSRRAAGIGERRIARIVAGGLAGLVMVTAMPGPTLAQAKSSRVAKKPEPAEPKPANIDKNGVLILVRSAVLALDQANKTGNYTVLRDLGSPNFRVNTAARLAEIFASHRQQNLDLAGVAVLEPQLTMLPQIETNGMLHMAGFFPSVPAQVNFEMFYEPVDRQWRLFGISVNLSTGGPVAPEAPAQPVPKTSTEPPQAPTASIGEAKPKAAD